jgi:hypothetical protein
MPSHGEDDEGDGGRETSARGMGSEDGDGGTPDGEPSYWDGIGNLDNDVWEDTSRMTRRKTKRKEKRTIRTG